MRPIRVVRAIPAVLCAATFGCNDPSLPPLAVTDGGSDAMTAGGADAAGPGTEAMIVNPSLFNSVLGRPTDSSIAVSVLAAAAGDQIWVEYGNRLDDTHAGIVGALQTSPVTSVGGEPMVVDITGLGRDTKYYYRVHYAPGGKGDQADNLHSFRTQRAPGATFHFGVQGDSHPERHQNKMFHAELYTLTMQQVRDRQPDLYFLLGDDFSIEDIIQVFKDMNYGPNYGFKQAVEGALPYSDYVSLPHPFSQPMLLDGVSAPRHNSSYLEQRKLYLGLPGNATPLMLVNGNHEEARAPSLGGIFNNSAIWAADARLRHYPLPAPGAFYSVDTERMTPQNGYPTIAAADGLLRDYYAFTWGDALFVTIDPYWHSPNMPETTLYNGDAKKKNLWDATMGDVQYAWLKQTLETSTAKWKFVFTHHVNGTGRGGAAAVVDGEWGGAVADFKKNRPSWPKPIHQLLVDNKVTIFFQGHDHMYAREVVDGVVYQEAPNPGDNSYFAYNCDAYAPAAINWQGPPGYGKYDASYSVRLPDTGFLDVTVSPDHVRVDYVRTYRDIDLKTNPNKIFTGKEKNGEVAFSYSVPAQPGDNLAKDFPYTCIGAAPPMGWVYNP